MRVREPCTSPLVQAEARLCSTRTSVAQKEGQNFFNLAQIFCLSPFSSEKKTHTSLPAEPLDRFAPLRQNVWRTTANYSGKGQFPNSVAFLREIWIPSWKSALSSVVTRPA
jgi:hypothetical protein